MAPSHEPNPEALGLTGGRNLRKLHGVILYAIVPETGKDSLSRRLLPIFAEAWIFATVVVFIVVRVLGSDTAKHLVHSLMGR
jgi:hypothetical protein